MTTRKDPTKSELQTTIKRIWRHSFQSELDSALEQHLRARALDGVQAALETALLEELFVQRSAAIQALGNPIPFPITYTYRGATPATSIPSTARSLICVCPSSAPKTALASGTFLRAISN